MEPYFDAADLFAAEQAKKPYYDWNEDDGFFEIYVYSPYTGRVLLSIPVTQVGYDRIDDLVNSLLQVRQYLQERLSPSSSIGYNLDTNCIRGENGHVQLPTKS